MGCLEPGGSAKAPVIPVIEGRLARRLFAWFDLLPNSFDASRWLFYDHVITSKAGMVHEASPSSRRDRQMVTVWS